MPEIIIKDLTKMYGKTAAVDHLDLHIPDRSFITLLGPSGCGKTTTLRMIAGLETPTSGEIIINGQVVFSSAQGIDVPPEKRNVGFLFQNYALWPHMTVYENITFGLENMGWDKAKCKARAEELLEMLKIKDYGDRYPAELSGGQQQRVAIARTLAPGPKSLFMDEPLSNLDAKLRESMRFEISALQKRLGITVIYVTHDQSEAMTMSDRIVVMSAGVVQQIGKPYEIYTHPANKMVADFIGLVNFLPGVIKSDRAFLEGTENSFANEKNLTGNVTIAVRPENIKMSKTGGMIKGSMKHRFYLGDSVDYRVQVGEHVIRVIIKGIQYGTYADGETVYLDFDKVMLFNRE